YEHWTVVRGFTADAPTRGFSFRVPGTCAGAMVGCYIDGGSIAIAGKPARQAFAGVPVGFVDGIAFRLDLHFSVRGRRLVRSSRAAARHVAVFVNRDLYIRVVSCPGTQGNRDGPAFHCDRDLKWRLSLAADLWFYICDVVPDSDSCLGCFFYEHTLIQ